jgi:hypothetical protein
VRALAVGIAKAYMDQQSSGEGQTAEEEPAPDQAKSQTQPNKHGRKKETVPVG